MRKKQRYFGFMATVSILFAAATAKAGDTDSEQAFQSFTAKVSEGQVATLGFFGETATELVRALQVTATGEDTTFDDLDCDAAASCQLNLGRPNDVETSSSILTSTISVKYKTQRLKLAKDVVNTIANEVRVKIAAGGDDSLAVDIDVYELRYKSSQLVFHKTLLCDSASTASATDASCQFALGNKPVMPSALTFDGYCVEEIPRFGSGYSRNCPPDFNGTVVGWGDKPIIVQ